MAHHYANASAVVWNVADEWVYLPLRSHTLLPTVALFNDDVLLGDRSKIGPYVDRHRPVVIVTNRPASRCGSSILPVIAQWYVPVFHFGRTRSTSSARTSRERRRLPRTGCCAPAAQPPDRTYSSTPFASITFT